MQCFDGCIGSAYNSPHAPQENRNGRAWTRRQIVHRPSYWRAPHPPHARRGNADPACIRRRRSGRAEIHPEFADALRDLEGFSHVWLLYWLHQAGPARLIVQPFLEDIAHGLFATRAPTRPNPLGLSLVRLLRRDGCVLHLEDVDILDGTPLLDIKPYVPRFDCRADVRTGWLESVDEQTAQARGRRQPPTH
jgi:tRNA-Thr(GGU) m(6)t(6)A37 methyltransferase TsaA